jgi:hypothetical protein
MAAATKLRPFKPRRHPLHQRLPGRPVCPNLSRTSPDAGPGPATVPKHTHQIQSSCVGPLRRQRSQSANSSGPEVNHDVRQAVPLPGLTLMSNQRRFIKSGTANVIGRPQVAAGRAPQRADHSAADLVAGDRPEHPKGRMAPSRSPLRNTDLNSCQVTDRYLPFMVKARVNAMPHRGWRVSS